METERAEHLLTRARTMYFNMWMFLEGGSNEVISKCQ